MANYTEIRIFHKTPEDKAITEQKLEEQCKKLGLTRIDYIRLIIELDVASGIIERLKGDKQDGKQTRL